MQRRKQSFTMNRNHAMYSLNETDSRHCKASERLSVNLRHNSSRTDVWDYSRFIKKKSNEWCYCHCPRRKAEFIHKNRKERNFVSVLMFLWANSWHKQLQSLSLSAFTLACSASIRSESESRRNSITPIVFGRKGRGKCWRRSLDLLINRRRERMRAAFEGKELHEKSMLRE